jgi:hypothetical protein
MVALIRKRGHLFLGATVGGQSEQSQGGGHLLKGAIVQMPLGRPLSTVEPDLVIFSDASLSEWGVVLNGGKRAMDRS